MTFSSFDDKFNVFNTEDYVRIFYKDDVVGDRTYHNITEMEEAVPKETVKDEIDLKPKSYESGAAFGQACNQALSVLIGNYCWGVGTRNKLLLAEKEVEYDKLVEFFYRKNAALKVKLQ